MGSLDRTTGVLLSLRIAASCDRSVAICLVSNCRGSFNSKSSDFFDLNQKPIPETWKPTAWPACPLCPFPERH
jgi:hypothetical protein